MKRVTARILRWFGLLEAGRYIELRIRMGQPRAGSVSLEARNTRRYPAPSESTAMQLWAYFEPQNQRLDVLLGRSMGW